MRIVLSVYRIGLLVFVLTFAACSNSLRVRNSSIVAETAVISASGALIAYETARESAIVERAERSRDRATGAAELLAQRASIKPARDAIASVAKAIESGNASKIEAATLALIVEMGKLGLGLAAGDTGHDNDR